MTPRATQDELDIVLADHRAGPRDSRDAIRLAILAAAADRRGLVHITGVRRHLPEWVTTAQIGAVVCRLVRRGYLVPTGRYEPNGDRKSRNASKRAAVRRLVKPIPPGHLT